MIQHKARTALSALVLSVGLMGGLAGPALADNVKTCTEETGRGHFTQTSTQTSACNSNSDTGLVPGPVENQGGNVPPGQQP